MISFESLDFEVKLHPQFAIGLPEDRVLVASVVALFTPMIKASCKFIGCVYRRCMSV
jgi:hypothetical protein